MSATLFWRGQGCAFRGFKTPPLIGFVRLLQL
jgi:hypothetical protein